jgi:peptidoglycan/LPS O-acetylase OafA/YrhL
MIPDRMKARLVELDGLRGLAVMMVVFGHAQASHGADGYAGGLAPLNLLKDGELGVRIFFVLSGFLITSILMAEYDWSGTINLLDFYKRRVLRIFPAFYIYLLFITGLTFAGVLQVAGKSLFFAAVHLLNYAVAISLLVNWKDAGDPGYPVVGHFWTLSLEEQFYWLWPVTLIWILRRKTFWIVPVLLGLIPLVRVANYFLSPGTRGQLYMMFHTASDVLLFGCLLAIGFIRRPDWVRRLVLPSWAATGLILFTLFVVPFAEVILPFRFFHEIWVVVKPTAEAVLITLIVANVLLQPEAWYARLLRTRVLVFLGTISYSVYLWQQLFCLPFNTTFTGWFPINLFCAAGMGFLSHRLIERPFLRAKNKRYSHAPPLRQEIELPGP